MKEFPQPTEFNPTYDAWVKSELAKSDVVVLNLRRELLEARRLSTKTREECSEERAILTGRLEYLRTAASHDIDHLFRVREEWKSARAELFSTQRRNDMLTSQLATNEVLRSNQYYTITELQADVEDLDQQLSDARDVNADLRYAAKLAQKLIDDLQRDLENVRNDYAGNIHILGDYKATLSDTQQVLRNTTETVDSVAGKLGLDPDRYSFRSDLVVAITQKLDSIGREAVTGEFPYDLMPLQAEYAPYYNAAERASLESFDQAVEDYTHYKGE